jgi:hypothetical protein
MEVNKALVAFGFAMGPFAVSDMSTSISPGQRKHAAATGAIRFPEFSTASVKSDAGQSRRRLVSLSAGRSARRGRPRLRAVIDAVSAAKGTLGARSRRKKSSAARWHHRASPSGVRCAARVRYRPCLANGTDFLPSAAGPCSGQAAARRRLRVESVAAASGTGFAAATSPLSSMEA